MGLFYKGSTEEICKYCIKRGERGLQKGIQKEILANPRRIQYNSSNRGYESIFVHDVIVRRKLWLPKGIRPVVTTTGSHQRRTCVFDTLTMEGKHLFR